MKIVWALFGLLLVGAALLAAFGPWRAPSESYQPRLEADPPPPAPPAWATQDFEAFLERLRQAGTSGREALLLHGPALERAEAVFRGTAGVMSDAQIELHAPFY